MGKKEAVLEVLGEQWAILTIHGQLRDKGDDALATNTQSCIVI